MNEENSNLQEENGISLNEILFILRKNLVMIVIITFLLTVIGGVYGVMLKKVTYSSSSTTVVQVDPTLVGAGGSVGSEYSAYQYSTYLVNSYADFIKSKSVSDAVAEAYLGAEATPQQVSSLSKAIRANTTVKTSNSSLIVIISYTTKEHDGKTAEEMNQEVIDITNLIVDKTREVALTEENGELLFPIFANKLSPMSSANEATSSRGLAKILVIFFAIGLVISLGISFLLYLLDDTYTSKEELERVTGFKVIAYINKVEDKVVR